MTSSILNDCLLLRQHPFEKTKEYLKAINLPIFDAIISKEKEIEAHQTILYILCAYSEDSPLLILRQDAREEKNGICEYLQIPEFFRERLITLADPIVKAASIQYIEQFAGYEFKTLQFLKIQHDDFMRDITNRNFPGPVKKSDGSDMDEEKVFYYYDSKEHGKAMAELKNLARAISGLEDTIANKTRFSAIEELKAWRHRGAGTKIALQKGGVALENSDLLKRKKHG